jgi:flavin reductase (DIM6/NTAB) family NADH-FMN oxidoreductase RutF
MMKDLGPSGANYGHPMPVLMVGTYDENGTVDVMNLHWCTMSEGGHLTLCLGETKKTHENIKEMGAFTVALVNPLLMKEADYFGIMSGYKVPDKFARTGLNAVKSAHVNAPIIEGSPLVYECKLSEIVKTGHFHAVIGKIINVVADESVLDENGRLDAKKTGMLLFDSFSNNYVTLGEKAGEAWKEGRKYV